MFTFTFIFVILAYFCSVTRFRARFFLFRHVINDSLILIIIKYIYILYIYFCQLVGLFFNFAVFNLSVASIATWAVRTYFRKPRFLVFIRTKNLENFGFRFLDFQVRIFSLLFMSNSVKLYEFIGFVTFNIAVHKLIFV